jgi:hypothetical protein
MLIFEDVFEKISKTCFNFDRNLELKKKTKQNKTKQNIKAQQCRVSTK